MADTNRRRLLDLLKIPGNDECAECGARDPEWASCNIGIFLCENCAGVHRRLGTDISRIKSIQLDNWDSDQVQVMADVGNEKARQKHEKHKPPYIRQATPQCPEIIRMEWILAKYSRKEFVEPDKQTAYSGGSNKEGYLLKRGRDDRKYQSRKFVLNRQENKLSYFQKDGGKPKAEISLDDINAVFVPKKMEKANGLQITYIQKGSTRNLYVYTENSKDVMDWYYAIRSAKLERRKIAFPDRDETDLAEDLTRDFIIEGWLSKMGPNNEPFKKRWFILDKRKLMYLEDKLEPFAKGEVFIGHRDGDYSVSIGAKDAKHTQGYLFTLHTPGRSFILSADTKEEMQRWICALQKVIETPLTPQDAMLASVLVPKRTESFKLLQNRK